jgi:hypothetical protein
MRYVRTYIFVTATDPRASRSKDDTSLHAITCWAREPVKYFGIICRSGSESDLHKAR